MLDLRITKENSDAIGFVLSCLYAEALTIDEMNQWADSILLATDDYPEYILELCVYKGLLKDLYNIIGFSPPSGLSEGETDALCAIADRRGFERYELKPSKENAASALKANPQVLERFKEQFSFVQINSLEG